MLRGFMIDTSQDWAARLRPAIEPRDPKATKLEDMRTCSVATAPTHEHCIAIIQEGMVLCARPLGVHPRSAGMRALPRYASRPRHLLPFESVGISPNGGSIAIRCISGIMGMSIRQISDIQPGSISMPWCGVRSLPSCVITNRSAFLCCSRTYLPGKSAYTAPPGDWLSLTVSALFVSHQDHMLTLKHCSGLASPEELQLYCSQHMPKGLSCRQVSKIESFKSLGPNGGVRRRVRKMISNYL